MKNNKAKRVPIGRIIAAFVAVVVFGLLYMFYGVIFFWFSRIKVIGWLFCVVLQAVVIGAMSLATYLAADHFLVVNANDYAGLWAARHKKLKWQITYPISIIIGAYFAVLPFIWESLSDIIWPFVRTIPAPIFAVLRLTIPLMPAIAALVVEWVMFNGKSQALHDKSDDLRRRRITMKQRLWELAVKEHNIPQMYLQVKNDKYHVYSIPQLTSAGQSIFYYDEHCDTLKYHGVPSVRVKNSERIEAIEKILQKIELVEIEKSTWIDELLLNMNEFYIDRKTGSGEYVRHNIPGHVICEVFSFDEKPSYTDSIHMKMDIQGDDFCKEEYCRWLMLPDVGNIAAFKAQRAKEMEELFLIRMQYYLMEYKIIKAGLDGERAVQKALSIHEGAFFVMYGLRLEFPRQDGGVSSVETDALVLSPTGVFAIEVKNYGSSGGYKIVVDSTGNWYKEFPARGKGKPKRETMDNPFTQNDRHVSYLNRFINDLLGRNMDNRVEVQNIIVLANDNVDIENDPVAKQTLTRAGNLYNQISQSKKQVLTMDELTKIKSELESRALPEKEYPLLDYSGELKMLIASAKQMMEDTSDAVVQFHHCVGEHPEITAGFCE